MFAHRTVLLFTVLSFAGYSQTLDTAKIDALAEAALKSWQAPGCAVAILRGDQVVFQKGYGVKEIGKPEPVTPKTVFAIGSTTKAFTTALLAILNDEGRLNWDDPVRKYLPGFQLADPLANEQVTVRDLVSHRTGLSRNDALWYGSPWSRAELLERIGRVPLTKPFRSTWQYQNLMFLAAGEVAGAAAGTTWDALVQKRIFDPLKMTSTSVSTLDAVAAADHATPHVKRNGKLQTTAWRNIDNIAPAGSINSNLEDLTSWLRVQMNYGMAPNGIRLISARNMREMHTPQMAMRPEDWGRNNNDETSQMSYGLGWFLMDYRGHHVVTHGGAIDGFRASFSMLPKERIGVIVMSNLGDDNMPEALRWSILDELLGVPSKDWNGYVAALDSSVDARQMLARNRKAGTKPSLDLGAYAGYYEHPAYGLARVTNEAGTLYLDWNGGHAALEHYHYDTFLVNDSPVQFQVDAKGAPARLEYQGQAFLRAAGPYNPEVLAARIVGQLKLRAGEQVIVRLDPGYMADLAPALQAAVARAGGKVSATLPYVPAQAPAGDVELANAKLRLALKDSTVYLWMPLRTELRQVTKSEEKQLVDWLKQGGARREIHFHWNGGSVLADGLPTAHNDRFDGIYAGALDIDYTALAAAQNRAVEILRAGAVRVRTPAGTDISFSVGNRPFNRQDGDASAERMASAKVQVDREIELPSGVLRVAPLEETARGVIVIPEARFGNQRARMVRLKIFNGIVTEVTAETNAAAAREAILTGNVGERSFREFGLGFNPKLLAQKASPILPYFAYGAGMVRMSLGDNEELGGAVKGGGRRWFFFPDATVEANGRLLVDHGKVLP